MPPITSFVTGTSVMLGTVGSPHRPDGGARTIPNPIAVTLCIPPVVGTAGRRCAPGESQARQRAAPSTTTWSGARSPCSEWLITPTSGTLAAPITSFVTGTSVIAGTVGSPHRPDGGARTIPNSDYGDVVYTSYRRYCGPALCACLSSPSNNQRYCSDLPTSPLVTGFRST